MDDREQSRPLKYPRVTHAALRSNKLEDLRRDFARIAGVPFRHFFCPILYRDEPAELCLGHVVNASLTRSDKYRVIQRADVDSFFGSVSESDFVRAHEREAVEPECPVIRAAIVASLLKAAHLTLFFLLGYRYALSPGGWFLGHRVLGSFFRRNSGSRRRVAARRAVAHYMPYANLVRRIAPAPSANPNVAFSPHELRWYSLGRDPYALVAVFPVRGSCYAVIVPTLSSPTSEALFRELLGSPPRTIEAHPMRLRRGEWIAEGTEPVLL